MIPQQLWQHSGHLGKMKGPAQLLSLGLAISGSWESQCTWRFLADRLIWGIVTSDETALTRQPTEMGFFPLKQVLCPKKVDVVHIPTHTFVSFPPWKAPVAMGQLCFLSRQRKIRNSTPHAKTKPKPLLSSLAESPQPKLCTAERNFQKIKNSTITRNTKINYISEPPYEHDCRCRAHASPDQGSPVNFIAVNEQWCQKTSQKLNKMAELLKIIFTTSNQTFQLPPH